jgi:hypothetical protein
MEMWLNDKFQYKRLRLSFGFIIIIKIYFNVASSVLNLHLKFVKVLIYGFMTEDYCQYMK